MLMLIIPPEMIAAASAINAAHPFKKIKPITLTDGRLAVNADLLTDCGPGQTWEDWAALGGGLVPVEVDPSLFPVSAP